MSGTKEHINEFSIKGLIQLESMFLDIVTQAKELVKGDECSIFLREEGTTRYILKDSTTINNPFLGNYFFEASENEQIEPKMGVTKYIAVTKKLKNLNDIRTFEYWHYYNEHENILKSINIGACEIPHSNIGPYLGIPLMDDSALLGVIRVVKSREKEPFTEDDEKNLEEFITKNIPFISGTIDISTILEAGSMLDVKALCTRIVQILTKMISARGCSIFILTDEMEGKKIFRCMGTTGLHAVLPNDKFTEVHDPYNEAFYEFTMSEKPDHLHSAIIKHGRNLNTPDISRLNAKEIFPDMTRKRAKYWETCWKDNQLIPAGPSIYIPLFSPRRYYCGAPDVIGVISINRPEGSPPFEEKEYRLVLSLSERLSKIILLSKLMHAMNQPINIDNDENVKKSFESLIRQICLVSGAPGATLFGIEGDVLIKWAAYGSPEEWECVYPLPSDKKMYGKQNFIGLTTWVATFKQIVMYNDREELNHWPGPVTKPVHSGKPCCETGSYTTPSGEIFPPDRFLCVPICADKETLGVLRTAKSSNDPPFTENDKIIFSSLATILSPVIKGINDLRERDKSKKEFFETIFSKKLRENIEETFTCSPTPDDFIAAEIKDFFSSYPKNDLELSDRVLKSINQLWVKTKIATEQQIKHFQKFNDNILSELPGYRDHFIHQYQVFLLGQYIIEKLNAHQNAFHTTYYETLLKDERSIKKSKAKEIAQKAWIVTSTYHDIAYPLQEINRWLPNTIKIFLGNDTEQIVPKVAFEKIFFIDTNYLSYVDELTKYQKEINYFEGKIDENDFRNSFILNVKASDHGVLSSLILLRLNYNYRQDIILPAALAIALHKNLGLHYSVELNKINIEYEKNPLLFLLLYCDLVQEWGRSPKNKYNSPHLTDLFVTDDVSIIEDKGGAIPEEIRKNNTIYVFSEIEMDDPKGKIKECDTWFPHLLSHNPYFMLKINDEVYPKLKNT
jgi:hypothetical protein